MEETQSNTQRMSAELHEIMRHAQALLEATGGELDEQVKKARQALSESMDKAKDRYGEYGHKFLDTCKSAATDADKVVKDKPYHVIGGTFIVGLLLGWILSRK
ncbi:MAG: DUF883 family protein [Proteobacteria bacterium]|nr:DUF883 family protein [Pseudomonadota bacterium]MBU1594087.1 DUF883 family protein [Pseudomonadota bacterium]